MHVVIESSKIAFTIVGSCFSLQLSLILLRQTLNFIILYIVYTTQTTCKMKTLAKPYC